MRHAKSSWDTPDMDDHERPLNPRGQAGAKAMAQWLANLNMRPDYALVSDAARTRETWELMQPALGANIETDYSAELYLATPIKMLEAIQNAPESASTVILIAHQPGMSVLVERLSDGSEPISRDRAFQNFPTAATALVDVPVDKWSDVDFGKGVFTRFSTPKELAGA